MGISHIYSTTRHLSLLVYAYSVHGSGNKLVVLFRATRRLSRENQLDYSLQITANRTVFVSRVETDGLSLFTSLSPYCNHTQ